MNISTLIQKPAEAPRASLLTQIKRGIVAAPIWLLIYAPEGMGKSTFAAAAPKPIWLGADNGTHHLDIARYPEPHSWTEVLAAIDDLTENAHEHITLVVDPLGWFEPMLWDYICKRDGKANIEAYGYGKGYEAALIEWRLFVAAVERLSDKRGMNVIFIAHSQTKKQASPDAESFDRYTLQLNEKAAALFRQRCDYVLFAKRAVWTEATDQTKKRFRGISNGERYLHTAWSPAYDAKSRPQLPDPIPFREQDAWLQFMAARDFVANRLAEKKSELEQLLAKATPENADKARAFIAEDPKDVTRYDEVIAALKSQQAA